MVEIVLAHDSTNKPSVKELAAGLQVFTMNFIILVVQFTVYVGFCTPSIADIRRNVSHVMHMDAVNKYSVVYCMLSLGRP